MNKDIAPKDLRAFLDKKVAEYNRASFVSNDPISIPHEYTLRQDIEIAAFFTAIFSWGNRTTIIRKSQELMQLMDRSPYQFVLQHEEKDLQKFLDFRHRTFNATDLLYFIAFQIVYYYGSFYEEFHSYLKNNMVPNKDGLFIIASYKYLLTSKSSFPQCPFFLS